MIPSNELAYPKTFLTSLQYRQPFSVRAFQAGLVMTVGDLFHQDGKRSSETEDPSIGGDRNANTGNRQPCLIFEASKLTGGLIAKVQKIGPTVETNPLI